MEIFRQRVRAIRLNFGVVQSGSYVVDENEVSSFLIAGTRNFSSYPRSISPVPTTVPSTSGARVRRQLRTRNLHFAVRPVPKVHYSEALQEGICLD
jgi:hypothetical protein